MLSKNTSECSCDEVEAYPQGAPTYGDIRPGDLLVYKSYDVYSSPETTGCLVISTEDNKDVTDESGTYDLVKLVVWWLWGVNHGVTFDTMLVTKFMYLFDDDATLVEGS